MSSNQKETEKESKFDEWDSLYDDSGECVKILEKLKIGDTLDDKDKPKLSTVAQKEPINYFKWKPKSVTTDETETVLEEFDEKYSHIIEIYDFPTNFKNENIINAFKDVLGTDNLTLKWVDDTHCLGIFANSHDASKALSLNNALVKTRQLSQATVESRKVAQRKIDYLKPYKPRPQTSSLVAGRLIGASLGLNNMMSKEKVAIERKKIVEAKNKTVKEKELKEQVWNGDV